MLASYVWRDLVRNPRRTLAAVTGIALGVGLFSAVLFFVDGSSASMTQRAVAPLPIDMQRVLTAPLGGRLRLTQTVDPPTSRADGEQRTVHLELLNETRGAANEVVLRSEPPPGVVYVAGSARLRDAPVPGAENPFARGAAKTGLNVGSVPPGGSVTASYGVRARGGEPAGDGQDFRASFSSREVVTPVRANVPPPLGPDELAARIRRVDGVAAADQLSFLDLPSGSLSSGSARVTGGVRLFAFDAGYTRRHRDIDVLRGTQVSDGVLLSAEAARQLGTGPGGTVTLAVPGGEEPLRLRVSGEADLRRARSLFSSRQGSNLEDFLYTPHSVVVDPSVFQREVVPAVIAASAARGSDRNLPVREVDVQVARDRLAADPGTALRQTRRIARHISAVAADQDYLIDDVSNALGVARSDAALAKRMFVFLGVPGALLAAILAGYAGALLASAQRRELAVLRVRGANRSHLVRMLALRTVLLTGAGAVLGLAAGFLTALAVLGAAALTRASAPSLVLSALIGAGGGFLAAGTALYAAGRASIRREIADERAQLFSRPPRWSRLGLDVSLLIVVGGLTLIALRVDAFAGTPGSVYAGRGVSLDLWLLVLPLGIWIAGGLLAGRLFAVVLARLPGRSARFPHLVRGVLGRSLRRRSWVAAQAIVVLGLIVAAVVSMATFTASYDRAKAADARFGLGSDIRVSPEPTSGERIGDDGTRQVAAVPGVAAATPVVFGVENARLRGGEEEDAANLAAVDPRGFLRVAALRDDDFVGSSASEALRALADDPAGILLSAEIAHFLRIRSGDPVLVIFDAGASTQATAPMHVVGLFERLPAFPDGADAMVNLAQQRRVVPSTEPSFFLVRTRDGSTSALRRAATALAGGVGGSRRIAVETRATTLDKDQSSLAALNIRGLLTLDSGFGLAMAVVAIGIVVFGLLLQRRREYVTMRAQGMEPREIRALVVAETGTVAVAACVTGVVVGIGMAVFLVTVLRPLFVLPPRVVVPAGSVVVDLLLVCGAALAFAVVASGLVGRLDPTELLREE